MREIIRWDAVPTVNYGPFKAAVIFAPSLDTILRMKKVSSGATCIIKGTGVYDGKHKCILDEITAYPGTEPIYCATLDSNWQIKPSIRGVIDIL